MNECKTIGINNCLKLTKYISKMLPYERDEYMYQYMVDNPFDDKKIEEIKNDSSEFIEENYSGITREELAKRMGISKESLKKRLLHRDRPISRDFVIALCSQLQLGFRNTNYALKITGHPLLYGGDRYQKNSRDQELIKILQQCSNKYMSLEEINNRLIKYGENPLCIGNAKMDVKNPPYIVLDTTVKVISYDEALYNYYDSLETLFDINSYCIQSEAILRDNSTNNLLRLVLYKDSATLYDTTNTSLKNCKDYHSFKEYSDILRDLNKMIEAKRKDIFLQLDDTKNYNVRSSARYIDNDIQFFSEAFNFIIPEKNEYLFATYFNHNFHFYISNKSQFMHYQAEDECDKFIKRYNPLIKQEFSSLEEIVAYYEKNPSSDASSYFDKKTISSFENLHKVLSSLILNIKQNDIYIRNPDIYEGPNLYYDMCKYYGLEKQFDFIVEEDKDCPEPVYQNNKNSIEIEFLGITTQIDLDDVYNAFIYGLNSVEDICQIKSKYGSFQNWIENL